jgi:hypothetical protein
VKWDDVTLVILAVFGCITLLLTQISEVLSRLPQIIRAWRQVRHELRGGTDPGSRDHPARGADPGSGGRTSANPDAGRGEG